MAKIDFAWELGGHTGHVTTLLPIARAMQARGHEVRFLLRDTKAGADLAGAADIPRQGAPIWVGPPVFPEPLNFGQILHNFGYHLPDAVRELIGAWRERLAGSQAVIANVAPAAHLAARTLGIPSFEISQGFHVPPIGMPTPPLRDWEPAPRAALEAADRRVIDAVNGALAAYGTAALASIGELFAGRALLLTYPELDIYPERGPAEYFGVPKSGEGSATPEWPPGRGPRVFGYLYNYYDGLAPLLDALRAASRADTDVLPRHGSRAGTQASTRVGPSLCRADGGIESSAVLRRGGVPWQPSDDRAGAARRKAGADAADPARAVSDHAQSGAAGRGIGHIAGHTGRRFRSGDRRARPQPGVCRQGAGVCAPLRKPRPQCLA